MPASAAKVRVLQFVALARFSCVVKRTISATARRSMAGVRSGLRAYFSRPASPLPRNRILQRAIFFGVIESLELIAGASSPTWASNKMGAFSATRTRVLRPLAGADKSAFSSVVRSTLGATHMEIRLFNHRDGRNHILASIYEALH